jgi:PTH1 family peptidyl-tRNA hydrolase
VTGALGSQEWLRLRIGVGLDLPPGAIADGGGRRPGRDYLLSPMRKAGLTVLDQVLDRVATVTRCILEQGPAAAMNEFNRKEEKDREQESGITDQN